MKKSNRKVDIIIMIVLALAVAAAVFFTLISYDGNADDTVQQSAPQTADTLSDKRVGVMTGSVYEKMVEKYMPAASVSYFEKASDMAVAVSSGKIDAFVCSLVQAKSLIAETAGLTTIPADFPEKIQVAFAFPKTEKGAVLRDEINEFLRRIKADGTYDKTINKWFKDEYTGDIDRAENGTKGTLKMATTGTTEPYSFVENGKLVGLDVDLAEQFCIEYGYKLDPDVMDFGSLIPGLDSGVYDFAGANITVTPERAESVYFSDIYAENEITFVVKGSSASSEGKTPAVTFDKLNDPGISVGIITGTAGMLAVEEYLPDAKEIHCQDQLSAYKAVENGTFDAFVFERAQMQLALDNGLRGVMLLDENLGESTNVAVGLSRKTKINGLEDSINAFLAELRAKGSLDEMYKRWCVDKDYTMPDIAPAASPEFTLVVGTTGLVEPYSFYADNTLTGYDIELTKLFAAWLNADLEILVFDYPGVVAAAQSGKVDCIFANLNVTDERKEVIDFSDPVYKIENGIMVRDVSASGNNKGKTWPEIIAESFEKNFIREDRWMLIVQGIGTTCLITVLSAIGGSLLAFLICLFRRTGSRLANTISNIYVKLLQGTPIIVLLMILYYIIFGKSGLEAVWVAVIGFSLNFGAYASEIMRSGIESIDPGQREAALALGYSENQAFFGFIFPQAAARFIPVFEQETVSLLKGTAVVGYIAIQDLTKMSDIIRSRTYEAFFPLIVTAVIYFILAWILSIILRAVLRKIDRRRKRRHGKGGEIRK